MKKITLVIECFTEHDRTKSNPRVELCVGTIARPARYRCLSLSTSTHRTGTLATGRTATMNREPVRDRFTARLRCLCRSCLRSSRNTVSCVPKVSV